MLSLKKGCLKVNVKGFLKSSSNYPFNKNAYKMLI